MASKTCPNPDHEDTVVCDVDWWRCARCNRVAGAIRRR